MRWNESLDTLYSPRALTLDEIWDAIRPPPLKPVNYDADANTFGFLGGTAGGILGLRTGRPAASALGGSYLGNMLGLTLYDNYRAPTPEEVSRGAAFGF